MKETYYFVNKIIKNKILAGIVSFFVFFILIWFFLKAVNTKRPDLLSFKARFLIVMVKLIPLILGFIFLYLIAKTPINYHPK